MSEYVRASGAWAVLRCGEARLGRIPLAPKHRDLVYNSNLEREGSATFSSRLQ
jgi:hypothetical protein